MSPIPVGRARSISAFAATTLTLHISLTACERGPYPCVGPGQCPPNSECLANRCSPLGGEPVPPHAKRVSLPASEVWVVDASNASTEKPASIHFGSRRNGAATLFVRFTPPPLEGKLAAAWLILSPVGSEPPATPDVPIEAWRVRESWRFGSPGGLEPPALVAPRITGIARSNPPRALRLDLTSLLQDGAERQLARGFAVRALAGPGYGVSFATGESGAPAPRVDLYLK